ncbi:hypothetical protein TcWFU_005625 [Taenia crassiceps]|uniref:Secreted protein n=1 Tax=Taenia crassiceps TaxID=6207 RepID=A0ABR4Q218_9CEST
MATLVCLVGVIASSACHCQRQQAAVKTVPFFACPITFRSTQLSCPKSAALRAVELEVEEKPEQRVRSGDLCTKQWLIDTRASEAPVKEYLKQWYCTTSLIVMMTSAHIDVKHAVRVLVSVTAKLSCGFSTSRGHL